MQDVQKRLVLAMQVREKMLRALGQAQHSAQVRHLRRSLLDGLVLLAQQLEIADILRRKTALSHDARPFFPVVPGVCPQAFVRAMHSTSMDSPIGRRETSTQVRAG